MKGASPQETTVAWERIAKSYSETRNRPWDQVVDFLDDLDEGSRLVDVGCGNGRHLIVARRMGHEVIGLDGSPTMAQVSLRNLTREGLEGDAIMGDMLHLPLADQSVDAVLLIASLHTLPGKANRHQALEEVRRVLRPGGKALVTVWARWQDRFMKHFLRQGVHRVTSTIQGEDPEGEFGDIEVPWRDGSPRFYHLMSLRGMVTRCTAAGFLVQDAWSERIASKWLPDNHFAVLQRPKVDPDNQ